MIIVKLIGGLGNQLFQYATGRYLAEENSTILKLDLSGFETYKLHRYALHSFHLWEYIAGIEELETFKRAGNGRLTSLATKIGKRFHLASAVTSDFYGKTQMLIEKGFPFDPAVASVKGHAYLDGYWQSEKYFLPIRNVLLRELTVKHQPDAVNAGFMKQIRSSEAVSIHIRRGDFVQDKNTLQIHGICSLDYYRRAVEDLSRQVPGCHFFVFSDDHAWVAENFKIDHPMTMVDHNDAFTNYEDLRLMSLCKHNIIANSSFSWWGAWLNSNPSKLVYAPSQWFGDPTRDTRDIVPASWIKI